MVRRLRFEHMGLTVLVSIAIVSALFGLILGGHSAAGAATQSKSPPAAYEYDSPHFDEPTGYFAPQCASPAAHRCASASTVRVPSTIGRTAPLLARSPAHRAWPTSTTPGFSLCSAPRRGGRPRGQRGSLVAPAVACCRKHREQDWTYDSSRCREDRWRRRNPRRGAGRGADPPGPSLGQLLTQADGAAVRVLQNEADRFDVVIDGSRGLITTFSNLSQKWLERLGTRYGWE